MLNSKGKPNITFEMGRQQQVRPSVVSVGRHENNSDKRLWCDLDCCRRESFFQHAFLCQYHAAVPSVASGTGVHQCHRGNPIGLLLLFQRCSVLAAWGADRLADCRVPGKYSHGLAFRTVHVCIAVGSLAPSSTSIWADRLGLLVHADEGVRLR